MDDKLLVAFTEDSKFAMLQRKDDSYGIYRTSDGSEVCKMSRQYFEPATSMARGGSNVILGLVDIASRKFMEWSIKDLLHISQQRIQLFADDLSEAEIKKRNEDSLNKNKKRQILG